jgi:hypothetical protein
MRACSCKAGDRTCAGARVKPRGSHAHVCVYFFVKDQLLRVFSHYIARGAEWQHMRQCSCDTQKLTCACARVSSPFPECQHMRMCSFLPVSLITFYRACYVIYICYVIYSDGGRQPSSLKEEYKSGQRTTEQDTENTYSCHEHTTSNTTFHWIQNVSGDVHGERSY